MCLGVLLAFIYVCHVHTWHLVRRVPDLHSCEPSYGYGELNPYPLEKQPLLVTTESIFSALKCLSLFLIITEAFS